MREVAVVTRAAALVDSPRRVRALARVLEKLETSGARAAKLVKARAALEEARAIAVPQTYSATRSFHVLIRRLLSSVPKERLEFDLLFFSQEKTRGLCDQCHMKPTAWALPEFQSIVYGGAAPEGSMLADAQAVTADTLPTMLAKHPYLGECYSFVRSKVPPHMLTPAAKLALAHAMPLGDALWHWEELNHADSAAAVDARLAAGERLAGTAAVDNFGKVVERLLCLRRLDVAFWWRLMPHAERLLEGLKARRIAADGVQSLQHLAAVAVAKAGPEEVSRVPEVVAQSAREGGLRVVVLGDASASMQVAINAACICSAMAAAVFDADLVFFNDTCFRAATNGGGAPKTADQVLQVTEEVSASRATSPAAALYHYYAARSPVDLFILVSDEGENRPCQDGCRFAALFEKYLSEVNAAARCSFVSFLDNQDEGHMLRDMKANGSVPVPKQYRFDAQRPDLSKFDALLTTMLVDAKGHMHPCVQPP